MINDCLKWNIFLSCNGIQLSDLAKLPRLSFPFSCLISGAVPRHEARVVYIHIDSFSNRIRQLRPSILGKDATKLTLNYERNQIQ